MSTQPEFSGATGDPFGRVLGHGRGLNDSSVLEAELGECENALAKALSELQAARLREDALHDVLARLTEDVNHATAQQGRAERILKEQEARETKLRVDRDKARYAAMRAGVQDPPPGMPFEPVHQGVWTPGRPFLSYQHAWHPKLRPTTATAPTAAAPQSAKFPAPALAGKRASTSSAPARHRRRYQYKSSSTRSTAKRYGRPNCGGTTTTRHGA